jgi:hypothetical protein
MLRLKRVQYRGIRIALRFMCLTPNNSLGVLSGIAERFVYLNFRYLVAVFYLLDHPLKRRLETLRKLNLGRCIAGYSDVLPMNVVSSQSFTQHDLPALLAAHFVGDHMERALSGVQTSMYPESGFGYKISSPTGIFTVELSAFFRLFNPRKFA